MGIQDTDTLDRFLDGRYIYRCTSSMMDNNQKEEKMKEKMKDSTINENSLSTDINIDKL